MYQYMSLGIKPAGFSSVLSVSSLRASDQYMSLSIKPAGISLVHEFQQLGLRASVQYYGYPACGHQPVFAHELSADIRFCFREQ